MKYFIALILIDIAVPLSIGLIIYKTSTAKSSSQYVFRYSKPVAISFMGMALFFVSLYIAAHLQGDMPESKLWILVEFGYIVMMMGELYQTLRCFNFRLELKEEFMLHRNLFGITRKIKYEEITKIYTAKDKSNTTVKYVIYMNKRRITVDNFMLNFYDFPHAMKKRLGKLRKNVQFVYTKGSKPNNF